MIIGFLKYRKPRPQRRQRHRAFMSVTQLEMRLAPATLVSAMDVTYLDEHNQMVDVHISQPVFNAAIINEVFTFKSGSVNVNRNNADPAAVARDRPHPVDEPQCRQRRHADDHGDITGHRPAGRGRLHQRPRDRPGRCDSAGRPGQRSTRATATRTQGWRR